MSILDNLNPQNPTPSEAAAQKIVNQTRETFRLMTRSFNEGSKMFWQNLRATPSEIAEKLGTDAREVFELHYALGQLISNIKPEAISEGWSAIGEFIMNEDGTVTVLEQTTTTQPPENS